VETPGQASRRLAPHVKPMVKELGQFIFNGTGQNAVILWGCVPPVSEKEIVIYFSLNAVSLWGVNCHVI
jgi:hypothetical protein